MQNDIMVWLESHIPETILLVGGILAILIAITYAKNCGLDPQDMFNAISTGAAGSWQMTNNGQKIINGEIVVESTR